MTTLAYCMKLLNLLGFRNQVTNLGEAFSVRISYKARNDDDLSILSCVFNKLHRLKRVHCVYGYTSYLRLRRTELHQRR